MYFAEEQAQLRRGGECINNGGVERVTQVGGPVVERAFSGGGGLDGEAQEANHGETGVLDLSQLEGGLLLWVRG